MLSNDEIIEQCLRNLPKFGTTVQGMRFEDKGIFKSEILLFNSLTNYFGVK